MHGPKIARTVDKQVNDGRATCHLFSKESHVLEGTKIQIDKLYVLVTRLLLDRFDGLDAQFGCPIACMLEPVFAQSTKKNIHSTEPGTWYCF